MNPVLCNHYRHCSGICMRLCLFFLTNKENSGAACSFGVCILKLSILHCFVFVDSCRIIVENEVGFYKKKKKVKFLGGKNIFFASDLVEYDASSRFAMNFPEMRKVSIGCTSRYPWNLWALRNCQRTPSCSFSIMNSFSSPHYLHPHISPWGKRRDTNDPTRL